MTCGPEPKATEDARFLCFPLTQSVLSDRARQMDVNFFEFWGSLLVSVARGQEQLGDMMRWVNQSFPGPDDLTNLLGKAYGLNRLAQGPTGRGELWKETLDRFHQSYREYLKLLNVVPRVEYEALQRENDSLKRKIVELEGAVGKLRALLAQKRHGAPAAAMDELQISFLSYLEKLQRVMTSFADMSKSTAVKEANKTVGAESDKGQDRHRHRNSHGCRRRQMGDVEAQSR